MDAAFCCMCGGYGASGISGIGSDGEVGRSDECTAEGGLSKS